MDAEQPSLSTRQSANRRRKIIGWSIGILAGIYLLTGILLGPYREYGYCTVCGSTIIITCYQIPLTELTLYRTNSITRTPFSRGVCKYGFVKPHTHQWTIVYGKGNAIPCALYNQPEIAVHARVKSEYLDQFIDLLMKYRGRTFTHRWIQRVFTANRTDSTFYMSIGEPWSLSREEFEDMLTDKTFTDYMLLTDLLKIEKPID